MPGVGERGVVVERREAADRDRALDAPGSPGRSAASSSMHAFGALERRAVGKLHGDHRVALVLGGDEAGRHARQAPARQADQHQRDRRHPPAPLHHEPDQPHVPPLQRLVHRVEPPEEPRSSSRSDPVALSHNAHCVGFSVSAFTAEINAVAAITSANCRYI